MIRQNPTPGELSPAQAQALAALLEGRTITQAADRAGVCRQTVHEWLRSDPAFIAEFNAGRHELVQAVRGELRALAGEAVRLLRETITTQGVPRALRVRAALAVLRMVGADVPEALGSGDPESVAAQIRLRENSSDFERVIANLSTHTPPLVLSARQTTTSGMWTRAIFLILLRTPREFRAEFSATFTRGARGIKSTRKVFHAMSQAG